MEFVYVEHEATTGDIACMERNVDLTRTIQSAFSLMTVLYSSQLITTMHHIPDIATFIFATPNTN